MGNSHGERVLNSHSYSFPKIKCVTSTGSSNCGWDAATPQTQTHSHPAAPEKYPARILERNIPLRIHRKFRKIPRTSESSESLSTQIEKHNPQH
mmetsp:Transcript_2386/g.8979  ORF Transcript_2386/g.8979 Transcript_2386/m.8979 type:complete len:94 (-) Transcript_2386:8688-8969(-)